MAKTPKQNLKMRKAEFSLLAPQAKSAFIAGDFNQWDPYSHSLKKDRKGTWKIALPLHPGRYEYRFFVDGEWQNDPYCSSLVENPFGTFNCLKIIE
jgi:1,4-alpha-glucan branching enzyme